MDKQLESLSVSCLLLGAYKCCKLLVKNYLMLAC